MKSSKVKSVSVNALCYATAASSSHGIIQFYDMGGQGGPDNTFNFSWDIDQDGTNEAILSFEYGAESHVNLKQLNNSFRVITDEAKVRGFDSGYLPPIGLPSVATIQSIVADNQIKNAIFFNFDTPRFIGFSFTPDSTKLHGWASVTLSTGGFSGIVTINNWAYEDSGAAITMGAIPESSDVALGLGGLALGAVGLRSWRKNKAKRKP
ncbi:hypothetical protein [Rubellicoccus peritrichatus]|uniref:PEP-CTERM protein-sorting domain-containing protein n=1 Tax=Rubellicoccus peritrichatus TaxID=3080537 RepID=A0AAQ3L948_9BACT|nr:hypothetical protein [Puniceicoccus sp. CR14]WOO39982.1 hypothetical protein RZN69_15265 [Puniceicoccus sp. CR14]